MAVAVVVVAAVVIVWAGTDTAPAVDFEPDSVALDTSGATLRVRVEGWLPTPCHSIEHAVDGPTEGRIDVTLRRVDRSDGGACTQGVVPVDLTIPVGPLERGDYRVHVGGKVLTGTVS